MICLKIIPVFPPSPSLTFPSKGFLHNTTQLNTTELNTTQHNSRTQQNSTQHNSTQFNTTELNTRQQNTQHNTAMQRNNSAFSVNGRERYVTGSWEWAVSDEILPTLFCRWWEVRFPLENNLVSPVLEVTGSAQFSFSPHLSLLGFIMSECHINYSNSSAAMQEW